MSATGIDTEAQRRIEELERTVRQLVELAELQAARIDQLSDARMAYRVHEVMELLGLGRNKIYDLIHAGKLTAIKAGRATIIPRTAIEAYLEGE